MGIGTGVVGMEPPYKDALHERGGRIDPLRNPDTPMDDDDRIDQGIAESFPASDPPSFNSGVDDGGDNNS